MVDIPLDGTMNLDPNEHQQSEETVTRTPPEVEPSRSALVNQWTSRVRQAKAYWEADFRRMKEDQDFVSGLQWSLDRNDDRYVANVTLRHVQQRTAALYAKNPTGKARVRERIEYTVWDGTMAT